MKSMNPIPKISRRVLLSTLAAIPSVIGPLRPATALAQASTDPLPSWNDGAVKASITNFVVRAATPGSPDFVETTQRVITFDNDGTLWCEQPMYVQFAFALDRLKTLAPQNPDWQTRQPFKAALEGDLDMLIASGQRGLVEIIAATHAGMTTDEFTRIVLDWLKTARHPRFHRPYTELVYQPMIELLAYLRASGFKTFIASGGGVEFMRPWSGSVYGVPPDQVIGSSIKTRFRMQGDIPVLFRLPEVNFINDGPGKPVGINEQIGQHPLAAFGNSDGDLQMLQWATMKGPGPHLGVLVHHTDAEREYAYDRKSDIGRLDKALDAAPAMGWIVVDMKRDWNRVFAFQ
jgi:haloacid dehalogenase-like hydrolase